MKTLKFFVIGLFAATLVSCGGGGGGSSTGSGSSSSSSDGVYNGTETFTVSLPGVAPSTSKFAITITIKGNSVTITDGVSSGTAPLASDGINFTIPVNIAFTNGGISCNGNVIHTGTVAGNKITGTISGGVPCRAGGTAATVATRGSFTATRSGAAKALLGNGLSDTLNALLQ